MKNLRRASWILAALSWSQAAVCGLSNLLGLESPWMISGMTWPLIAGLSALVSFVTPISALFEDDPAEKKSCVLCGLITIVISLLVAFLMFNVFTTWFGFGELSGEC